MAYEAFAFDSFSNGSPGDNLISRFGEEGGGWNYIPGSDAAFVLSNAGRIRADGTTVSNAYTFDPPPSSDYAVRVDVRCFSNAGLLGLTIRSDSSAVTYYHGRYFSTGYSLWKFVAGSPTQLGSDVAASLNVVQDYRHVLVAKGTRVRYRVDGVEILAATDSAISATGRPGITS